MLAQASHIHSRHQGTVHLAPRRVLRVEIQNHRLQGLADHQGKAHLGVAVPGPAVEHAFNNPSILTNVYHTLPYIIIHHVCLAHF